MRGRLAGIAAAVIFVGVATMCLAASAVADPGTDGEVAYCQDMASLGHLAPCLTLVSYGRGVCAQFDRGNDWYSILKALDSAAGDKTLSSDIMAAATMDICPWNKSKTP